MAEFPGNELVFVPEPDVPRVCAVIRPQRIPAAGKTHKAGFKGINLGLPNNLVVSTAVERTDPRDRMGDFQCAKMAFHGRSGDAQRRGRLSDLKLPAALAQHEFNSRREPVPRRDSQPGGACRTAVHPPAIRSGLRAMPRRGVAAKKVVKSCRCNMRYAFSATRYKVRFFG